MTTSSTRTTPYVGQTAQLSRTVGDDDITLFTEISGDRNPLHYDEAAAKLAWSRTVAFLKKNLA